MAAKARRKRILDQQQAEIGAVLLRELRELAPSELRASLAAATKQDVRDFDEVVRELRKSARREGLNRALAQHVLQDPVSSILGRVEREGAAGAKSKSAREASALAGAAELKPRYAVVSPATVARFVEVIEDKHPDIVRELKRLGLRTEEGTELLLRILDYSKERRAAGFKRRVRGRGGILYEMLLSFQPDVVAKERAAASVNASEWILREPERFGTDKKGAPALVERAQERLRDAEGAKSGLGRGLLREDGTPRFGELERLEENLFLLRLTDVRDESGRLMSDHFRVLLSFSRDRKTLELVPVGVGESKFQSKVREIIPQLIRNLERAQETLRASNLPHLEGVDIQVRWGKALVVVAQSEKAVSPRQLAGLEDKVREATGALQLKVSVAEGATAKQAQASKDVVDKFMRLAALKNLGVEE
ncbi:hypothetical protein FGE12_26830 [Aggregicoccus sp. 17bor-14]|uniref:hypothetical protein n=1 Tax=Myxococcaceae TaxID=31 RepID=UPI00129CC5C8|nr:MULTISPECIES: hypothetical protein [Myxococcaceae]MBF5046058.1 hypothetical protein [Simulacricoccus sp. 17bor-14]MRI91788.1 hypothetical protein [Aggregicoccus sp. 17bor-14]